MAVNKPQSHCVGVRAVVGEFNGSLDTAERSGHSSRMHGMTKLVSSIPRRHLAAITERLL